MNGYVVKTEREKRFNKDDALAVSGRQRRLEQEGEKQGDIRMKNEDGTKTESEQIGFAQLVELSAGRDLFQRCSYHSIYSCYVLLSQYLFLLIFAIVVFTPVSFCQPSIYCDSFCYHINYNGNCDWCETLGLKYPSVSSLLSSTSSSSNFNIHFIINRYNYWNHYNSYL